MQAVLPHTTRCAVSAIPEGVKSAEMLMCFRMSSYEIEYLGRKKKWKRWETCWTAEGGNVVLSFGKFTTARKGVLDAET
jgi:hypothetical protein